MIQPQGSAGGRWSRGAQAGIAALLVIAIICVLIVRGRGKAEAPEDVAPAPAVVETVVATIRSMEAVVNAQGTLVPAQGASAKIAAVSPGRLLTVPVKEGERVVAGQLLATVDSRVQQAQATGAESALRAATMQADQAQLGAQAAAASQATAVQVARLELQSAETELHKLRRGARPQELAQADQAVAQARATNERAATELERVRFLYDKGLMAKRQLEDASTALALAQSALETAKAQADLLHAGARPEDLRGAELRVEVARANLEQARRGALEVAGKQKEAAAAGEAVNQKRADLDAAQTSARYAELRSPVSGVVVHRWLNPGDMADPASPVMEIAATRTLDVTASLPADDGGAVRRGMPARVSATGATSGPVTGTVLDVGQIDPQTGLLAVRVTLANPGALKAGAFATAEIVVRTIPRAVAIPRQAVISRSGKPSVFVVSADNVAHERKVTTGVENAGMVEIVRGVASGERVIRLGQYALSNGAKVRLAGH